MLFLIAKNVSSRVSNVGSTVYIETRHIDLVPSSKNKKILKWERVLALVINYITWISF